MSININMHCNYDDEAIKVTNRRWRTGEPNEYISCIIATSQGEVTIYLTPKQHQLLSAQMNGPIQVES